MIDRRFFTAALAGMPLGLGVAGGLALAADAPYFPPAGSSDWDVADAAAGGWNTQALDALWEHGQAQGATGIVIVHRGRIIAERYWPLTPDRRQASGRFSTLHFGETPQGWPIEDVASIQKSVMSLLIGIAWRKGQLDIERAVSSYIGEGWARAAPDAERAITVRHLLGMASGLDEQLRYESPAGTRWLYNTPAYGHLGAVLERATGAKVADLSAEWLTAPIGMNDSRWQQRPRRLVRGNEIGFVTTPRDLARLGVLLLNGGSWRGRDVIATQWLRASLSPSQGDFAGYGYLWWLNRGGAASTAAAAPRLSGWHVPSAPPDMFAARGHFNRRLYVVPSLELVVVRLGRDADAGRFDQDFWPYLARALPAEVRR